MCVWVCLPQHVDRGKEDALRSWFSPSIRWTLGIKLRWPGLVAGTLM